MMGVQLFTPEGTSQVRLLVTSDDSDESPYPDGVYVNVTKGSLVEDIHDHGFESDP
jgi:hypothetical protein